MPSSRIANVPVSPLSRAQLLATSRGANSTKSATDTQIVRITCAQISQALRAASAVLNGGVLHQLCAEILVFSEDAIKAKCNDTEGISNRSSSPRMVSRQRLMAYESVRENQTLAGSI